MIVRTQRKDALFAHLITSGILVRDVSSYILLENCLRINVGTSQENEALKQAVKTFFAQ
jgi:histidinol-phosphate aminotransferase